MTPHMMCAMQPASPATDMLARILTSALIAGAVAGLIAALLQLSFVQPVLLHAELYEQGALTHFPAEGGHDHHSHDDSSGQDSAAEPDGHSHISTRADSTEVEAGHPQGISFDVQRDGLSILFTLVVYCGWGLLLVAAYSVAEVRRRVITVENGVFWGICGFVAVQLAPAFGLPPELPGMAAVEIGDRMVWWLATVVLTAAGIAVIAFGNSSWRLVVGIALILAPQVIGAPHPHELTGPTPPELAAQFAGRALGTGLVAWAVLGALSAKLWSSYRFGKEQRFLWSIST